MAFKSLIDRIPIQKRLKAAIRRLREADEKIKSLELNKDFQYNALRASESLNEKLNDTCKSLAFALDAFKKGAK